MKLYNFSCLVLLLCLGYACKSEQPKHNISLHNKKVLILGNSITQNGKYVDFLEYYLRKSHPKEALNIISIGLSSETVSGDSEKEHSFPRPCVHSRLDKALELTRPDLVLACYGMNDGIYSNLDPNRFNNYKNGIQTLRKKVQATGADFILMSPTPFDARQKNCTLDSTLYSYKQPYAGYNDVLRTYSKWLLGQKEVKVIDLHTALENELTLLKTQYLDSTFITDGVHPNTIGHFYMAKKILADTYPNIPIGDPVSELEKLKKDSLFMLSSKRRKIRSKGWLEYIGYIRKDTMKSNNIQPTNKKVKALDLAIAKFQNYQ